MRFIVAFMLLMSSLSWADNIIVTTWNIEHLGTEGRGFGGGYGGGNIPLRTGAQLDAIAQFIENDIQADVLAVQEIGITHEDSGYTRSTQLDHIVAAMGPEWRYILPPKNDDHGEDSMYVGYIWNAQKVRAVSVAPMAVPRIELAGKALFDRVPMIGYFEILDSQGQGKNDFALVNVHLASGQHNDENHLIAMTLIEYRLTKALEAMGVRESDRIILGDFNDNPYRRTNSGRTKYSPAMYQHMFFKGFVDYVTPDFHSTRMDQNLTSVIDHVLVNSSAARHVENDGRAWILLPSQGPSGFAQWRQTYSDHFPISVAIRIGSDDDVD